MSGTHIRLVFLYSLPTESRRYGPVPPNPQIDYLRMIHWRKVLPHDGVPSRALHDRARAPEQKTNSASTESEIQNSANRTGGIVASRLAS